MRKRVRRFSSTSTAVKIFLSIFLGGVILSLLAACTMLLFSDESGSPLPKAAEDLSTFDLLYLRAYLRWNNDSLRAPSAQSDGVFEVYSGETATEICARLQQAGWIPSAELACNYLRYTGGDRSIGSGLFLIRAGQTPRQIADSLASAESKIRVLTVFAGWRLEEIAEALAPSGISLSPVDWMAAALGRPDSSGGLASLYAEIPSWAGLEGFLSPAEYRVAPGETAAHLVERMALQFQQSLPSGWIAAVQSRGLSIYQAVTVASIIQREAVLEEEMPLIASVIYNRLAINMRLQVDPTVQYAAGYQAGRGGWWANPVLDADLGVDSPYNTYLYEGLPPGPICNPSLAALQAAANPASSPFLYFRAACDGSGRHNFAETYIQHLANACGG
jgi:UPF0755 protein